MADNKEIIEIQLNIKRTGEAIDAETKKLLGLTHGTDAYNKSLEKTGRLRRQQAAEVRVQTDLITKANGAVRTGAGQANQAVQELGRGISDLPYGVQGVANNFSQLVDVVGSISQKTGGLGKAFASIGKSMLGPLGIVIGIQTLVALVVKYEDEILSLFDSHSKLNDAFDEASEEIGEEVNALNNLITAYNDVNTTQAEAIRLRDKIREDYPEYLSEIDSQTQSEDALTIAIDKQTKAIIARGVARALEASNASRYARLIEIGLEEAQDEVSNLFEVTGTGLTPGSTSSSIQAERNYKNRKADRAKESAEIISDIEETEALARKVLGDAGITLAETILGEDAGKKSKDAEVLLKGSVEYLEKQLSTLKDLQSTYSTTSDAYKGFASLIEVKQSEIDAITGGKEEKKGSDKIDPLVAATRKAELAAAEDFYAKLELNRRYDIEDIKETNAEKIALITEQINKEYDARRDARRQKDNDKASAALAKEAAKAEKARLADIKKFTKTANDYRIKSDDEYALRSLDAEEQRQLTALEGVVNSEQKQNEVIAYFRNEREKIFKESSDNITKATEAEADARIAAQVAIGNSIAASFGAISKLFEEGSAASKTFALAEIATGTAVGFIQALDIAQKTSKAAGPAAAFAFPVFYASQIAAVLGAASQAKAVLDGKSPSAPSTASTAPTTNVPDYNIVGTTQATTSDGQPVGASGESGDDYIIKTYITSTDVSSRLALDRKVEQSSAL